MSTTTSNLGLFKYTEADHNKAFDYKEALNQNWDIIDETLQEVENTYVPKTTTINNKALSSNISLTSSDVGAAASSHNQASNTINAMTGYSKPSSTSAIAATDSLNTAIGKLEKALDGKSSSDTLMTQNVSNTSANYPLLCCPTNNATTSQGAKTGIFGAGNTLNPYIGGLQLKPNRTDTVAGSRVDFRPISSTDGDKLPGMQIILGSSTLDIKGLASADGTTVTGQGAALTINPYAKTITGGYTFTGNVTGSSGSCTGNAATATKATQDSDGNAINSTYLKKSGGTMTGALNFANKTWNFVGNDAYFGDWDVGGHICIKPSGTTYDSNVGFSFHKYDNTALVQLSASSGALTSSGSLGVSNNACKMVYNSTTQALEFNFA